MDWSSLNSSSSYGSEEEDNFLFLGPPPSKTEDKVYIYIVSTLNENKSKNVIVMSTFADSSLDNSPNVISSTYHVYSINVNRMEEKVNRDSLVHQK